MLRPRISPAIVLQPPRVLRIAARRAGVTPPHHSDGGSTTRQLVAELLQARACWDSAYSCQPPERVRCIPCAVLEAQGVSVPLAWG